MNISTRKLNDLPSIDELKNICRAITVIDIIYEGNLFSFGKTNFFCGTEPTSDFFNMNDGQGNFFAIYFNEIGSIIIGFEHESEMSPYALNGKKCWPGVIDTVPMEFSKFLKEFYNGFEEFYEITYCVWRKYSDSKWNTGKMKFPKNKYNENEDGSEEVLSKFSKEHTYYFEWAKECYLELADDGAVDLELIHKIFEYKPLSGEIIQTVINKNSSKKIELIKNIGYPVF